MKTLILFTASVVALLDVTLGYKIRRSECYIDDPLEDGEESTVMFCTCGGIGDPYSIIMNKVKYSSPQQTRHTH